jgi:lysozyme family protein
MKDNFKNALERVLASEGGFVNHPKDPGGPTNRGITIATFSAFKHRACTVDELKAISESDVAAIYRLQYWNTVKGDDLPSGLDYAMFDYAVNSGPGRAVKDLQRVIGALPDGVMGAMTLQAIKARDASQIIAALCDRRLAFLKTLKTWSTFGKGWGARVEAVRTASLNMAAGSPESVIELVSGPGKGRDQDISILRTPEGQAKIAAGAGAIGTAASQVADIIQPLSGQLKWVGMAAAALLIIGVLANALVPLLQPKPVPETV